MEREEYIIYIIGAGVSGLIAAKTLENNGYRPIILESTNEVGGRVKTDIYEGYQLDRGFQVLLEAYPKAQEFLDYKNLKLQSFLPGAIIYNKGKSHVIGDPLRNASLFWSTVMANVGSLSDKLKIFKLNNRLKKKSINKIFKSKAITTIEYLEAQGFSHKVIDQFFKPFFSGIFLESELQTSSVMFEFVYKMFGEGLATLPKGGIGEIPKQLASSLKHTKIKFNTKVKAVNDDHILLETGEKLKTHFTVIATAPSPLVANLKNQPVQWKSCYNLYFETESRDIAKPLIGLISDKEALINNIFFHNSVQTQVKGEYEILSVTVVKSHDLSEEELIKRVEADLKTYCGINTKRHLKTYHIRKALPDLEHLQYEISPTETQLKTNMYLAGDYLLNGSLNAAMLSGERAAQGLIMSLEDGLVIENLSTEYI